MNFAAMVLSVGVAGAVLAYSLQSSAASDTLVESMRPSAEITGSIPAAPALAPTASMRLIDMRSGSSCKVVRPDPTVTQARPAPIGPDCFATPHLSAVAYWRSTEDGSLVMMDRSGATVLEFAPADGALYESVFPANEVITIVPARG